MFVIMIVITKSSKGLFFSSDV